MTTALLTGANRGIGLALATLLHQRGTRVLACCRRSSPALDALGVEVLEGVDMQSPSSIERLRARVEPDRIDVLILNAGILLRDSLDELDFADVEAQLAVNALGPLRVTHALRSKLGKGSKLALVTSRMGSIGDNTSGGYYGYRMSKAALNAAGASLAHDLRPRGVAVAILHPGYVRTEMTDHHGNVAPEDAARQLLDRIDDLTLASSGRFLHANGDELPW